ncbi:MAG TPA: RluA family pseudouridine synthase [Thermoanaerobacterales bacterium]|nr:RluA family pseudouridine synthase [Thermoanaerobacterales bacterium]
MEKYESFNVLENEEGKRIDVLLAKKFQNHSRSFMQKLVREGKVKVNGKTIKRNNFRVLNESCIEVEIPKENEPRIVAEDIPIDVIYEDDYIAIINKRKGIVVHPAPGHHSGTLVNALMARFDILSNIGGSLRPGIVHRLDKDTSGVLIVAKKNVAHKKLIQQFKKREVTRKYLALVHGNIKTDKGTINAPIGRHHIRRQEMAVTNRNSRKALTRFKVIERFSNVTLVEISLETGRTHQIRVHMAYIGNPLIGDLKYGFKKARMKVNYPGHALHAWIVGFRHPRTDEYVEFTAPLPREFVKLIKDLRNKGGLN